ncbi:MAG: GNAT family N-acetyltransferase [Clostridia bacterium]|nr:GNAT family N-acetyltransferase [Clostridia bacterium]
MPDMLVKLYKLPDDRPLFSALESEGITIHRALAPDTLRVLDFVRDNFSEHWVSECMVALSSSPSRCFVAVKDRTVVGFACYDATSRGFFGPTGVSKDLRGKGIGRALLNATLGQMRNDGYGYAIIGSTEVCGFYEKCVGATVIPDSSPGVYTDMI